MPNNNYDFSISLSERERLLIKKNQMYTAANWRLMANSQLSALINNKLGAEDFVRDEFIDGSKRLAEYTISYLPAALTTPIESMEVASGKGETTSAMIQRVRAFDRHGINMSEYRAVSRNLGKTKEESRLIMLSDAFSGSLRNKHQYIMDKIFGMEEDGSLTTQTHLDLSDATKIANFADGIFGYRSWKKIMHYLKLGINPSTGDLTGRTRNEITPFDDGFKVLMDGAAFETVLREDSFERDYLIGYARGSNNPFYTGEVPRYQDLQYYNMGNIIARLKYPDQLEMIRPHAHSKVERVGLRRYDNVNNVVEGHPRFGTGSANPENIISRIIIVGKGAMVGVREPRPIVVEESRNFEQFFEAMTQDAFTYVRANPMFLEEVTSRPRTDSLAVGNDVGIMTIDISLSALDELREAYYNATTRSMINPTHGSAYSGQHVPTQSTPAPTPTQSTPAPTSTQSTPAPTPTFATGKTKVKSSKKTASKGE